ELPYKCGECGKSFFECTKLIYHQRSHIGERPYKCDKCKRFRISSTLIRPQHIRTEKRPFCCTDCGMGFNSNCTLVRHWCIHAGERPYECPKCGKSFSQSSGLTQH
ncbi:ZN397 protein, partial [Tichodroma muraria]|nr:ZN397 protein [Tichodroma muraria]